MTPRIRVFRAGIRAQQHRYPGANRSLAGFNFSGQGWDDDGPKTNIHQRSVGQSFSTMSQSLLDDKKKKKQKPLSLQQQHQLQQQQQQRTYLPLIVGVAVAIGWVAYRKSQGKPLTPDQAMAAESEFKKQQEKLKREREELHKKFSNTDKSEENEKQKDNK